MTKDVRSVPCMVSPELHMLQEDFSIRLCSIQFAIVNNIQIVFPIICYSCLQTLFVLYTWASRYCYITTFCGCCPINWDSRFLYPSSWITTRFIAIRITQLFAQLLNPSLSLCRVFVSSLQLSSPSNMLSSLKPSGQKFHSADCNKVKIAVKELNRTKFWVECKINFTKTKDSAIQDV